MTMGSGSKRKSYLHVAVYWGGAELGSYCRPFESSGAVIAGAGLFADIRSEIWPRWDSLEIISKTRAGLVLNPNIAWDGVLETNGSTHILQSLRSARRIFEIKPGSSASLRIDDLSVAIRVGPKVTGDKIRVQPARGYMASPLTFIAEKSSEWISLTTALLAAAIISISAYSTLNSRQNDHYENIAELPSQNLLPFISQKYLAEAPYVLQFSLDRFNYVHSVWNFYEELSQVIGFGKSKHEEPLIFRSTVDEYKELIASQQTALAEAEAQQKYQANRRPENHAILSIPIIRGESVNGKIQRILDKIAVYAASSKELVGKRNEVAEQFEKDIGLVQSTKNEAPKNEAFAKIAQGYLGIESDDKMQESQAKNAAARAALIQTDLFGKERLQFGAIDCCAPPVGAPITQSGLVWLQPKATPNGEWISMATFKGSTWGVAVKESPKIIEPIRGHIDPSLIERTVSAGRYQLRLCYELALRRNQAAMGTMEWRWNINSEGKISNINLLNSSIKDDELVRCIHDKIATWKFAKPRGGTVEVRYPFEFSKDKG